MYIVLVEEGEPRLPALLLEPAFDLSRGFYLGARTAAADQHAALLDDVEVAALESAGGDHVVDRNTEVLVGADGGVILAPPPPIGHGGYDGAVRRHDAGIARIDLMTELGCRRV